MSGLGQVWSSNIVQVLLMVFPYSEFKSFVRIRIKISCFSDELYLLTVNKIEKFINNIVLLLVWSGRLIIEAYLIGMIIVFM